MNDNEDYLISEIMNDGGEVKDVIQIAINKALLKHKDAGNPICESLDGEIVWILPEEIPY